ncbi:MAG: 50S ribosomal protein L23, partial [Acholeplasmataceae bacterium]|nr:50S ribosomal protein L23 [Acholeplasmataceae bacterium]
MIKYYEIIEAPIITEKSNKMIEASNTYTFMVAKKANK